MMKNNNIVLTLFISKFDDLVDELFKLFVRLFEKFDVDLKLKRDGSHVSFYFINLEITLNKEYLVTITISSNVSIIIVVNKVIYNNREVKDYRGLSHLMYNIIKEDYRDWEIERQ